MHGVGGGGVDLACRMCKKSADNERTNAWQQFISFKFLRFAENLERTYYSIVFNVQCD